MAKVLVAFYSTYGHNYLMAKAAVEGALSAGATADLRRIPETLPKEVLEKMHAVEAQKAFASVPAVAADQLPGYDAIVVVTPTRFGGVPAQVQTFFDQTGQLWFGGALIGKVGSAMVSSATQHGGQETTFGAIHNFFLHHGLVVTGLPGSFQGQFGLEAVKGLSPYGATTIAGADGSRLPSEVELEGARFQGKHVATLAAKLAGKH
eukprot:CAMPEP_0176431730 /NCGR_PEP_ID=MMETSP0127-20121128/14973_1 /TAXON_ID=938130 /ORGANISM="Platyophrya macrostoma, Strain WH" /LENGTH=205 /DNA_ID=CAMNT_0017813767 /DNA_START=81 /DNA_END=698 /DNA_ORIENTATION=+